MLVRTDQGKLVRQYFLECERVAKQTIAPAPPTGTDKAGHIGSGNYCNLKPSQNVAFKCPGRSS